MQDIESPVERAMGLNGTVTLADLHAELTQLGDTDMRKTDRAPRKPPIQHEAHANLRVEVQTDGDLFLSFKDHATRATATVRIDPANVGALASMLVLASDKEVDSTCYVEGGLEVAAHV